jgi:hypothetical protein
MAKLSVKKTRDPWSITRPRCSPAANPMGSEMSAASTALYATRNRVGGMCRRITLVVGSW